MGKGSILVTLTFAACLGLAGCAEEGGQASPATRPADVSSSAPTTALRADPFEGIDRCEVLNKAIEGEGFPLGKVSTVVRERGCDVDKRRYASLGLVLGNRAPYDEVQADPSEIFDGKINGRLAVLIKNRHVERDCAISMQVTEDSYAYLVVALFEGTRKEACDLATRVMQKIEPQLPKG